MRETPELTIEMSARTVDAIDREAAWRGIEVHRRCIEASRRSRAVARDNLLGRIDDVLAAAR